MNTPTSTTTLPLSPVDETITTIPTTPTTEATEATEATEEAEVRITTARTVQVPIFCTDRRSIILVISIVTILLGFFLQYHSFPEVKWKKIEDVDWSVPFSIFFGFMFNLAGAVLFGRPHWPLLVQLLCFGCSWIFVYYAAELTAWWDRLTMLFMLCGMLLEFHYDRRRRRRRRRRRYHRREVA